jgi:hypothetical protein
MTIIITKLYNEMTTKLEEIAISSENILQRAERSYHAIEAALWDLKKIIIHYEFKNNEEEIHFFKVLKPMFLKELFYFGEVFEIESWKPPVGVNEEIAHYMIGAKRMDLYFKMNIGLYTYYRTGSTSRDEDYFLRGRAIDDMIPPLSSTDLDSRFSTIQSMQFGQLQAYEQFSSYLTQSIQRLQNPTSTDTSVKDISGLVWTDSKTNLIEVGYMLFATKSFNFGKATLRDIISTLESAFNVRLGNYRRTFQNMRIRSNRTSFLKKGEDDLVKYMDSTDMDY